tara:strand:- start:418 stop:2892 length:2475 start_codon:yes stop_codon:yes gene_type:complete
MDFYTNVAQWGNNLLVRGVQNGQRKNFKVKYSPTLFVPVMKQTDWKTLDNKFVTPYKFDTIKEAREFMSKYESQPHLCFGYDRFAYTYISDTFPNKLNWNVDSILIVTIDIEVRCENGFPNPDEAIEPLLSITIKNHQSKNIVVWGIGDYKKSKDNVTYVNCKDENELILEFMSFWSKHQPDVITGWNTDFFDVPYLVNRIKKLFGESKMKELSPWGNVSSRKVFKQGRDQYCYDIMGVSQLDYFHLYQLFTYTKKESYKLDYIAFIELGEKKDDNPYETFKDWYTKDYQSFIDYNIQDVEIVDKLEDKMGLITLLLTLAYEAKVNFEDVFGQVKYWDILIYNFLRKRKIAIPQKTSHSKDEKYEGAYVKVPQTGLHKWVVSFDLNSLYPHLIMQYNISPETLLRSRSQDINVDDMLKETKLNLIEKTTMTPNGAVFKTDKQGFLPAIMQELYDDRVVYKKKMLQAQQAYEDTKDEKYLKLISRYNNIQMARKISLNSAYGAIGNQWFRYYDIAIAEGITTSGQLSIRWVENKVNNYLNKILDTNDKDYVIASDTDSIYITLDELVSKVKPKNTVQFLNKVATEKLEPFIDKSYEELKDYTQAFENKMMMKREVIADKGIWVAKKRYILNVHDSEGVLYKEPKLKMMGIEAVKSSTPLICREKIKEALKIIMSGDEKTLNDFIQDFHKKFTSVNPKEIAFPRSVNGLKKYSDSSTTFKKGTPMHIKGCLIYNHKIKQNKLIHKYPLIQEGDKIKFLYMKQPNPYSANVISFMSVLPEEFKVNSYIDYDIQFEKVFVDPLILIVNSINWKIDTTYGTQGTLEDFF